MKAYNVLSIGNSFSQDAHAYLHDLAKSEGIILNTVNLYIGGCSLEHHFRNMVGNKKVYTLEINGHTTEGFLTSIDEALTARHWDIVTLQQASHYSYQENTHFPYIERLADHIRKLCPQAKILIHQTWGYESGSERIREHGFHTYDEMFWEVQASYDKATARICADGILPSGTAFQYALSHGVKKIHRDTFHASFGIGRFILALVWDGCITGQDIRNVKYNDFSEPVTEEEYRIALEAANHALSPFI